MKRHYLIISLLTLFIFAFGCARTPMTAKLARTPLVESAKDQSTTTTTTVIDEDNPQVDTKMTYKEPSESSTTSSTTTATTETKSKTEPDGRKTITVPAPKWFSTASWKNIQYKYFTPLNWDKKEERKLWTKYMYYTIMMEESQMLGQNVADDIETFCPKYRSLSDAQRLNFWGQFFAALATHESSWDPTTRMVESTMGTDPITKKQVTSEGLLQLSYQDEGSYGLDCGFDWNQDKNLKARDPRKSILNPYLNLRCGIKIMSKLLQKNRKIEIGKGAYWAVIKKNGKYNKTQQISKVTKSLAFCQ